MPPVKFILGFVLLFAPAAKGEDQPSLSLGLSTDYQWYHSDVKTTHSTELLETQEWRLWHSNRASFYSDSNQFDLIGNRFPSRNSSSFESSEEMRLGLQYRAPVGYSSSFLYSQSVIDESEFGSNGRKYHQVFGYGLRLVDHPAFSFDIIPGLGSRYYIERPLEDTVRLHGNLQQNISWQLSEGFVVNQKFNTTLEKTDEENLSAVMNLDLETLFSDRLSFRLSYEVHYDDTENDIMEQRESRLSTSIGYRF